MTGIDEDGGNGANWLSNCISRNQVCIRSNKHSSCWPSARRSALVGAGRLKSARLNEDVFCLFVISLQG